MAEMTKEVIVATCKANGGYDAPRLNDHLYLHCKGFIDIKNLEPYTEAKVLWLEQNAITNLSGMSAQQKLVSLFLQNNTIRSLQTFSAPLTNLRVLNVSHNYISSLKGLAAACPQLETLQASHGRIASLEACEDLFQLSNTLTSVDLSFNKIDTYAAATHAEDSSSENEDSMRVIMPSSTAEESGEPSNTTTTMTAYSPVNQTNKDPLVIVNFFKHLPNVSVIYLQGNSISHGLKHYRRRMILNLPSLTYLDERPVFDDERRVVEAWGRGGEDAEALERTAIRDEKREHLNSCVRVLSDKMETNRAIRDQLTAQWEAKRAAELEALTQQRREHRDARANLETVELAAREALEGEAQNGRWDIEDAATDAYAPLAEAERAHRHAYEQIKEAEKVREEVAKEIAQEEEELEKTLGSLGPAAMESSIADLIKSDDAILQEMEEEIQNVLYSIDCNTRRRGSTNAEGGEDSPRAVVPGRATVRTERAVHAAVSQVAERLESERQPHSQQRKHHEVWSRFDEWERRFSSK